MTLAIRARGLTYQHATRPQPAFTGVDLDVERGERILISGDSGSGKSTLLAVIAKLIDDSEDGSKTGTLEVNAPVSAPLLPSGQVHRDLNK